MTKRRQRKRVDNANDNSVAAQPSAAETKKAQRRGWGPDALTPVVCNQSSVGGGTGGRQVRLACATCAGDCEKHADMHEHCRACAEACRRCGEACRELIDAVA